MADVLPASEVDDASNDKTVFEEASANVRRQGFLMKRELDGGSLKTALKHAATMVFELRTGRLSPQNYYDLYISVTDELRYLKACLADEVRHTSTKPKEYDLYEIAQYAGNILPRLYLLITVGAVYIEAGIASPMKILFDLVELCKGVQHPTRGLFLRCYLSQMAKDLLPDIGSEYHKSASDLTECIKFVVQNFTEVNRLWVRMQHQGPVRDRARREVERQNLRMLVGTNLVRLSQLEGIKIDEYQSEVLPKVLELIIECKDKIAQEYLMDCVIQVFPDEYHLVTLEKFLGALSELNEQVNVKQIIVSLMNRLSSFALKSPNMIHSGELAVEMFPLFQKCASKVMQDKKDSMNLEDILSLQGALINFASKVYPDRLSYLDNVLEFTVSIMKQKVSSGQLSDKCSKQVVQLLTVPLDTVGLNIFALKFYTEVMNFLAFDSRRQVSGSIAKCVVNTKTAISDLDKIETLFQFISPLVKDSPDTPPINDQNRYEFEEEQYLVSRLIHLLWSPDTDMQYAFLVTVRNLIAEGGEQRLKINLPPILFRAIQLIDRNMEREQKEDPEQKVKTKKILQFIHKGLSVLSPLDPNMSIRLYLQASLMSDRHGFEPITYEFLTQAFVVYEEEMANSKDLSSAVAVIVGTVERLRGLTEENYDAVSTQATQHSARLLKKADKTRAVYNCAHMFWSGTKESVISIALFSLY